MSGIFITGCGTDIGKTIITAAVLMSAKRLGVNATVFKPVQTGCTIIDTPDGKKRHAVPDLQMIAEICADPPLRNPNKFKNTSVTRIFPPVLHIWRLIWPKIKTSPSVKYSVISKR